MLVKMKRTAPHKGVIYEEGKSYFVTNSVAGALYFSGAAEVDITASLNQAGNVVQALAGETDGIPGNGNGGLGTAVNTVAGRVGDVVLSKADVGLDAVDNTSDADKPVSAAQAAAFLSKASLQAGELVPDPSKAANAMAVFNAIAAAVSAASSAITDENGLAITE